MEEGIVDRQDTTFGILADQYRPMLMAYGRAVLGDYHDAEDLVQETLSAAYRSIDTFEKGGNFGAWLRGIARNKMLESRRAVARRRLVVDSRIVEGMEDVFSMFDGPSARHATWEERLVLIRRCVAKLGLNLKIAVNLMYAEDLSLRAVARRLGVSQTAAAQRLFRARNLVRECVAVQAGAGES